MSQTIEQEQGAAPAKPGVRRDLELFWRIIAGLMLIIIAWIIWVMYQISPRSVVTPLAVESQRKLPGTLPSATGAPSATASAQPAASPPAAQDGTTAPAAPQPAPDAAAAALAMDQAQAGVMTGAHQSSADIQAAALEQREEQLKRDQQIRRERLKLSTEITTPLAERNRIPRKQQARPGGAPPVPAAADAADKVRR